MFQPLVAFIWGVLLLPCGADGYSLSVANPAGSASGIIGPATVSGHPPGPLLLSSILPEPLQSPLPQKGVSCADLMPDALEDFAARPRLSQIFIQAALALALQAGGCAQHADALVLHLYKELGETDANALLSVMARSLRTAHSSGDSKGRDALQFNLDRLAYRQARHCRGLAQMQGFVLHGQAHSVHSEFQAAATACHKQGNTCAGVVSNGTGFYQVVNRDGSYFLPHYGARSWLHRCQSFARNRRSGPEDCAGEKEQKIHKIVEWVPVVSTYYNLGTGIYYATQDCIDLAKERATEGAMDLGYDLLASLTGGASSIVGMGIAAGLKPVVKAGFRASLSYFFPKDQELAPVPANYSGPVSII